MHQSAQISALNLQHLQWQCSQTLVVCVDVKAAALVTQFIPELWNFGFIAKHSSRTLKDTIAFN